MTLASFYNPAFIAANGGTVDGAFNVLVAGMLTGQTYLNIHSTLFPGGEIRDTLIRDPGTRVAGAARHCTGQPRRNSPPQAVGQPIPERTRPRAGFRRRSARGSTGGQRRGAVALSAAPPWLVNSEQQIFRRDGRPKPVAR